MRDGTRSRNRANSGLSRKEFVCLLLLAVMVFGVAWPYFGHTARTAKRQASASNLQQWGIALTLYLTENENYFPETGDGQIRLEHEQAWYNSLPPYLSAPPLAQMNPKPQLGEASLWIDPAASRGGGKEFIFTYAMNAWLQPDLAEAPYPIYQVDDPGRVVFLVETLSSSSRVMAEEVHFRHGKKYPDPEAKAHVLFCDGHVELVPKSDLKDDPASYDPKAPLSKVSWVPFGDTPAPKNFKNE
jgi:prepilin-type processing-associated H-X9-DG protein